MIHRPSGRSPDGQEIRLSSVERISDPVLLQSLI